MESAYPKYFYKYREIKSRDKLENDLSLKSLFGFEAAFSSRKIFNDLFDSKILFVEPSKEELNNLNGMFEALIQNSKSGCFGDGEKIPTADEAIKKLPDELNNLIDKYPFYCVSKNSKSNLMWSYYAGSHTGFCIEFKSEYLKADKVTYESEIPKLEILDLIRLKINPNNKQLSSNIWRALRTKLVEWKHEEEYRFQASNSMKGGGRIPDEQNHLIVQYTPEFVESVIFGCKMDENIKEHIVRNMPDDTVFKQAIELDSSIEIVNSEF